MGVARGIVAVEIGPAGNYGVQIRPPWSSGYQKADSEYKRLFPVQQDVIYNETLKCFHFRPTDQSLAGINMELSNHTVATGAFVEVTPPIGFTCLKAAASAANYLTQITRDTPLAAGAWFMLHFGRDCIRPPAGQTEPCKYSITWGGGYKLTWGIKIYPSLTYPNNAVREIRLPDEQFLEYSTARSMNWGIFNAGEHLVIKCSAISGEPWTFLNTGVLEEDAYTLQASIGGYWFNVTPLQFPYQGYLETGWFDTYNANYTDDPTTGIFPTQVNDTSAAVTVSAVNGTQKKFRLTLTGDGGNTTPVVQGWQAYWLPAHTQPAEWWDNVTAWCDGGREELSEDLGSRRTTLDFKHFKSDDTTGWQRMIDLVGTAEGQIALRYSIGYIYPDGTLDLRARMEGLVGTRGENSAPRERKLTLTAYSCWGELARTPIRNLPSLCWMRADLAVALVAQWCKIAPWRIYTTPSPYYLSPPTWDFTTAPWTWPFATKGAVVVQELCKKFGLRAEFRANRNLIISNVADENLTPVAWYSHEPNSDNWLAARTSAYLADYTNVATAVTAIGEDEYGYPLYSQLIDQDSLALMGASYEEIVGPDTNLRVQADVDTACQSRFAERPNGKPGLRLGELRAAWAHWPREVIHVTDRTTAWLDRAGKITSISTQLGRMHKPTITIQQR